MYVFSTVRSSFTSGSLFEPNLEVISEAGKQNALPLESIREPNRMVSGAGLPICVVHLFDVLRICAQPELGSRKLSSAAAGRSRVRDSASLLSWRPKSSLGGGHVQFRHVAWGSIQCGNAGSQPRL